MIDFHSHVLPAMDDGAATAEESAAMLAEAAKQGVHTVVATSHYYRSQETIDSFLYRRAVAAEQMAPCIPDGMQVLIGAEVLMQKGVSGLDLQPLCIEGTSRILLELPFSPPPSWLYEEMENIALGQRLDVILAHVDRYMPWYSTREMTEMMEFPGLSVQLNADAFLDAKLMRALKRWLPPCESMVLGSDMHHIDQRSPNIGPACKKIQRKIYGRRWLEQIQHDSLLLLPPH